jgi:hypothetical protein
VSDEKEAVVYFKEENDRDDSGAESHKENDGGGLWRYAVQ